jgi:hypothetical protein
MDAALQNLADAFAELVRKCDLLRRENERLHEMLLMRWRPPQSAPRDETPILVDAIINPVVRDAGVPRTNIPGRLTGSFINGQWRATFNRGLILHPRWWMPLPPPMPACETCVREDECDYAPRDPVD